MSYKNRNVFVLTLCGLCVE